MKLRLDLTPHQLKVLGNRVLVALDTIEACTTCEATFTKAEQEVTSPGDNDQCPKCCRRYCCTTYYGDPQYQVRASDLGESENVFVEVRKRRARRA